MAIKILAGIAKDGTNEAARVAAAVALLDRGWGRAPQAVTCPDGEGSIQVVTPAHPGGRGRRAA